MNVLFSCHPAATLVTRDFQVTFGELSKVLIMQKVAKVLILKDNFNVLQVSSCQNKSTSPSILFEFWYFSCQNLKKNDSKPIFSLDIWLKVLLLNH